MNAFPFRPRFRLLPLCVPLVLLGTLVLAWAPSGSTGLRAQGRDERRPEKLATEELRKLKAIYKDARVIVYVTGLPKEQGMPTGSIIDVQNILGRPFLVLEDRGDPRAGPGISQGVYVSCIDCSRIVAITQVR